MTYEEQVALLNELGIPALPPDHPIYQQDQTLIVMPPSPPASSATPAPPAQPSPAPLEARLPPFAPDSESSP